MKSQPISQITADAVRRESNQSQEENGPDIFLFFAAWDRLAAVWDLCPLGTADAQD